MNSRIFTLSQTKKADFRFREQETDNEFSPESIDLEVTDEGKSPNKTRVLESYFMLREYS